VTDIAVSVEKIYDHSKSSSIIVIANLNSSSFAISRYVCIGDPLCTYLGLG